MDVERDVVGRGSDGWKQDEGRDIGHSRIGRFFFDELFRLNHF